MNIGFDMIRYKDEMVRDLCELIKIKSVREDPEQGKPFGEGPFKALEYTLSLADRMGFKTVNVDGYAGHAEYGEGNDIIGVLVHLDVVPEGEGWTFDPYGGLVNDNKIYGRGASDNKGPAIAALYTLKLLKDNGLLPEKRIRIIFGTGEETGMSDMKHYFSKEPVPNMGFSPDAAYPIINREKGLLNIFFSSKANEGESVSINAGDALNIVPAKCESRIPLKKMDEGEQEDIENLVSELNKEFGEKVYSIEENSAEMVIKSYGKSAHAAFPEGGINAIGRMLLFYKKLNGGKYLNRFLEFLYDSIKDESDGKSMGIRISDEYSGFLTLNLAKIEFFDKINKAGIDIRYPVTVNHEDIVSKIKERADEYGIAIDVTSHGKPLYVPADHPLIKSLIKAYEKITNEKAELLSMGGGTYARTLKNNGVAFGGAGKGGHQPDEHVDIDELTRHAMICAQAVYELTFEA